MALAKAPKPLLETQSMELVSRRKAGGQRTGELSFVTGHTHQFLFSLPDDVEHLLKLVLLSWLTSGKNHRLPSQCVRQELSGPCVSHLIAGIPKCFSKKKCKGSEKLCLQKRKFRFVHNLKRTKERKCPGIHITVIDLRYKASTRRQDNTPGSCFLFGA